MAFTSLSVQSFELTVTDILDGREPLLDEFAVSGTGLLEFDRSRKTWPRKKEMPPCSAPFVVVRRFRAQSERPPHL